MAVYTCFEMVGDCRANRPAGWRHFVTRFAPVARALLVHYTGGDARFEEMLKELCRPDSAVFRDRAPMPERAFVVELRMAIMSWLGRAHEIPPAGALADLTVVERQMVWLHLMGYDPPAIADMLNADASTVAAVIGRAPLPAGREPGVQSDRCRPIRDMLDLLDGRITWARRQELERHTTECWYCIDHLCRVREADRVNRSTKPLSDADAQPLLAALGVAPERRSLWQRVMR